QVQLAAAFDPTQAPVVRPSRDPPAVAEVHAAKNDFHVCQCRWVSVIEVGPPVGLCRSAFGDVTDTTGIFSGELTRWSRAFAPTSDLLIEASAPSFCVSI